MFLFELFGERTCEEVSSVDVDEDEVVGDKIDDENDDDDDNDNDANDKNKKQ